MMKSPKNKKSFTYKRGFTIIELVVSVAIFAFMTTFLVVKYGTFNQSVLLTNLAYDVALTIRNAQTYGLNVKSKPSAEQAYSDDFGIGYGVHFDTETSGTPVARTQMIFFADVNKNGVYELGEKISGYTLRSGSYVSSFCVRAGQTACTSPSSTVLDISFQRPEPNAIIKTGGVEYQYAEITLVGAGGLQKRVTVQKTGQISVLRN